MAEPTPMEFTDTDTDDPTDATDRTDGPTEPMLTDDR